MGADKRARRGSGTGRAWGGGAMARWAERGPVGPSGDLGRAREGEGERAGPGCWGLGWVPFLILPLFLNNSNLFEFKRNLNSNSYANQQLKPCTSMNATPKFKPMIKF